jgi:hypothetical protein
MSTRPFWLFITLLAPLVVLGACSSSPPRKPASSSAPSAPSAAGAADLHQFLAGLPRTPAPRLKETEALFLAALPLSCIDRPQTLSPQSASSIRYFHNLQVTPIPSFEKDRAFYGCYDWHSAVNSTWTLAAILKEFPRLPVASLIREKLNAHLGKSNIAGETSFFAKAKSFERPYGQSWLLKLYATVEGWNDPDARKWAANLAPLAKLFAANLREFIKTLPYPTRSGVHPNTAYSMNLLLDYADATGDHAMRQAVTATAKRFFSPDTSCPTAYEPGAAEFISPCLEEAKLMSRALAPQPFLAWFNRFLPPVYSPAFRPLWASFDVSGIHNPDELAGKSHLIGLSFERAEAMTRIADALPPGDPRAEAYGRLAAINAAGGLKNLEGAGYLGSHWLGTYALGYLLSENSSVGLPVAAVGRVSPHRPPAR